MLQDLKQCGSAGFFIVFLGVAGFVASLFAIVLAILDPRVSGRSTLARVALLFGPATAFIGLLAIALGAATAARGRRTVDAIVASGDVAPADVERLRALGYAEARTCGGMGVQSGAMPLTAGVVATAIALVRRRRAAAPSA